MTEHQQQDANQPPTLQEHIQHLLAGARSLDELSDQQLEALCETVSGMIAEIERVLHEEVALSTRQRQEYEAFLEEVYDTGIKLNLAMMRRQMQQVRAKFTPLIEQQRGKA